MDLKNGMVIKCNSEKEAKEFIKEAYKQGFKWVNHIDGDEEKTRWYTGFSEIYYYLEYNQITWDTKDFDNDSIEYSTLKEKMKTMTKSDLKNGMVVEYRDKSRGLVHNERIIDKEEFLFISNLNDDLMNDSGFKDLDIMKIFDSNAPTLRDLFNNTNLELIWERKEEKQELSKKDKKVIKKGLKKIQEECKSHKFCYGCMFDDNGACILDKIETLEIDKLFED